MPVKEGGGAAACRCLSFKAFVEVAAGSVVGQHKVHPVNTNAMSNNKARSKQHAHAGFAS